LVYTLGNRGSPHPIPKL